MREIRGLAFLVWLTLKRQATGKKAYVVGSLIVVLSLVAVLWARRNGVSADASTADFNRAVAKWTSQVVLPVYVSFILPIVAVVYATGAFGDEREERTLVHLLIRPLARYRIYLAKAAGILPLVLIASLGGFAAVCLAAGPVGRIALNEYWFPIFEGAIAYSCLFLAFGALFPRPVILAVVYAFFVESMLGNTPGTIKRVAISFHVQSAIYGRGGQFGLKPASELQFAPIAPETASMVLWLVCIAFLALGALGFHRKEFRDLD